MPRERLGSAPRVLIVHGGVGLTWLVCSPNRATRAYGPALDLARWVIPGGWFPLRDYGVLLIVIAVGTAVAFVQRDNRNAWWWAMALAMFWGYFTVLFLAAAVQGGSYVPPLFALGFAWIATDRALPTHLGRHRHPRG